MEKGNDDEETPHRDDGAVMDEQTSCDYINISQYRKSHPVDVDARASHCLRSRSN